MQLMLRAGHTLLEALEASSRLAARPRLTQLRDAARTHRSGGSSFRRRWLAKLQFPRISVAL